MKGNEQLALSRRGALVTGASLLALPAASTAWAQTLPESDTKPERTVRLDVPYVPTPQEVVEKMLELAKPKKGEFLIHLGSGDGRFPIAAARMFGVRALGVDLNPQRIKEAHENAKKAGVTDLVEFRQQDLFEADISNADVLTMYLLPAVNLKLRDRTRKELKPGARVVSHAFDMGDWKPDETAKVDGQMVHLWAIPDR